MTGKENLFLQCEKNIAFYTRHLDGLRKNIAFQEKAKKLLMGHDPKVDISEFSEMEKLNDYNGYLAISTLDLSVNLKNLILAKTDWEKIFFIKNSYLIIHETLQKLKPSDSKNDIEDTIKNNYPSLTEDLAKLMEEIEEYRIKPYYIKIIKTRHNTAGHINKSLKIYYDTILDLDGEMAGQHIKEFLNVTTKALHITADYAVLANKVQKKKSNDLQSRFNSMVQKVQNKDLQSRLLTMLEKLQSMAGI